VKTALPEWDRIFQLAVFRRSPGYVHKSHRLFWQRFLDDRDCNTYSRAALLSDATLRTTKPLVVGAGAVTSGSVTVTDRCAISRAGHSAKRPLGVAQVPGRRPTSEAAGGSYRRDRSPQSRRSQERNRYGCGDRDVITAPICGVPQYEDQRDRRISGRNSKSHSGVVPGRGQASGHCPHVSNIPVLDKSHSKRGREAKTIG